ncbi:MAG: VanW family protein [Coprococcus sp.]
MRSINNKKKRQKRIRIRVIEWFMTAVFLFLFYLIFCAFVGNKHFYYNTSINGIEVSKMTVAEAADAVRSQFEKEYSKAYVKVIINEKEYSVNISDALNTDVTDAVSTALNDTHSFISRGVLYIKSLFSKVEYTAFPSISDKNAIVDEIKKSGLNDVANKNEKPYIMENDCIKVVKGRGGYEIDTDNLVAQIEKMVEEGEMDRAIKCPLKFKEIDLDSIYEEIYVEPQNPTLDAVNNYEIVEAVKGVSFNKELAKEILDKADEQDEIDIPLIYTEPDMSTEEFRALLFRDTLGSFGTEVGGSEDRKTNVVLAAAHCNGTILLPGETFSFNNVVGQRTIDNGFRPAPSYVNGESVDEVGGGICQVSSTLYNACLYANLQIDERHCHPHESSYVAAGFDATVSWGGPDYVFTNNTEYPIKIYAVCDSGYLACAVYGTEEEYFSVELTSETVSVEEYKTEYEDDDTMEEGEEEVSVTGINGYTIQTYRKVYDADGNLLSNSPESVSVYSKRDEVVKVGTKKSTEESTEETTEDTTEKSTDNTTEKSTEETTEDTTEKPAEESNNNGKNQNKKNKKSDTQE